MKHGKLVIRPQNGKRFDKRDLAEFGKVLGEAVTCGLQSDGYIVLFGPYELLQAIGERFSAEIGERFSAETP